MENRVVIYYFSGTGNSWRLAKAAAAAFEERGCESFLSSVERGEAHPMHGSARYVGFVSCVLGFGLPQMVAKFMRNLPHGVGQRAFVLISIGSTEVMRIGSLATRPVPGFEGVCIHQARRLLSARGYTLEQAHPIQMPHNWIMVGDPPESDRVEALGEDGDALAGRCVEALLEGAVDVELAGPVTAAAAGLVYLMFLCVGRRVMGASFVASDSCNGCGVCALECPAGTIRLVGGLPRWRLNCQQCFRCIHLCPNRAIEVSGTAMLLAGGAMAAGSLAKFPSRLLSGRRVREWGRLRLAVAYLLDSACGLVAGSLAMRVLATDTRAREALPWWYLTEKRRRYRQPGFRPSRARH